VDGVLIIDKPAGLTSHDVVNRVRRVLGTKKVGHTGTLDPFATGVLVILVGKATRLAQFVDKDEKEYEATIAFGYATDTGDLSGERRGDGETGRLGELTVEVVEGVLGRFRGRIEQVPPMYSAKKVAGEKLYELARRGEEVERQPVSVHISKLETDGKLHGSGSEPETRILKLIVRCSAGTYIRTLAEDIGKAVGVGAHLTALRRTHSGRFSLDQAATLEELEQNDESTSLLLPLETAVEHLSELRLAEDRVIATLNGMSTRIHELDTDHFGLLRMTAPDGKLIAIGFYDSFEKFVQPKIVLH
jgi:tRNA pseudouridine55 synthase